MDWGGFDMAATPTFGGAAWVLSPATVREAFVDPTIIRSRLIPGWRTVSFAVGSNGLLLACGIIAWSGDPDSSAVPLDHPDAANDPEADWILHTMYAVPPGTPSGTLAFPQLEFLHESRAMRRLGNDRGILFCWEAVDANGNQDVSVSLCAHVRYLLKE